MSYLITRIHETTVQLRAVHLHSRFNRAQHHGLPDLRHGHIELVVSSETPDMRSTIVSVTSFERPRFTPSSGPLCQP